MNTGPYQFPGHPFPGVYIAGDDALGLAKVLRQTDEENAEMAKLGVPPKKFALELLLTILESCEVK